MPHAYYPAYPGSFWTYKNSNNQTYTYACAAGWHEFKTKKVTTHKDCTTLATDIIVTPMLETPYYPFGYFAYDRLLLSYNERYNYEYVLFSENQSWKGYQDPISKYYPEGLHTQLDPNKYEYKHQLIADLDTMSINSVLYQDIIVIQEDRWATYIESYNYERYIYFYALNVGPIRIEKYEINDGNVNNTINLNLENYYINN